jgi:shikimate kinase
MAAHPIPSVKIVGVCASGKSTLGQALQQQGYAVYPCAQEHSYVPDLWRRLHPADMLIYLDARADTIAHRRHTAEPVAPWLADQHQRLAHARQHCDLYLPTDDLTPQEVLAIVLEHLHRRTPFMQPPTP